MDKKKDRKGNDAEFNKLPKKERKSIKKRGSALLDERLKKEKQRRKSAGEKKMSFKETLSMSDKAHSDAFNENKASRKKGRTISGRKK